MSRRLKLWSAALLCCVILIAGIITVLIHMMNSDSVGTVQVDQQQNSQTPPLAHTEPVPVDTSYFTATLPADFSIKSRNDTPNLPFLLQLLANTTATEDEQLAITIGTMPADGLPGIGDYNLRSKETDTYQRTALSGLPAGAVAFQTVNSLPALTVFWPHGVTYAELAFSTGGGATYTQLTNVYSQLLAHWNWK